MNERIAGPVCRTDCQSVCKELGRIAQSVLRVQCGRWLVRRLPGYFLAPGLGLGLAASPGLRPDQLDLVLVDLGEHAEVDLGAARPASCSGRCTTVVRRSLSIPRMYCDRCSALSFFCLALASSCFCNSFCWFSSMSRKPGAIFVRKTLTRGKTSRASRFSPVRRGLAAHADRDRLLLVVVPVHSHQVQHDRASSAGRGPRARS